MSITLAVLTDRSCGEACWHAKEEVCRCECGGRNHGILLKDGAEQPNRHSKIDGKAYELIGVGLYNDMRHKFYELIKTYPPKRMAYYTVDKLTPTPYYWDYSEIDSPIRMKAASKAQCVLWKELTEYKGLSNFEFYQKKPYLLWKEYTV